VKLDFFQITLKDGVLHRLVSRGQIPRSILEIVLKAEACDINLQNETGETALMVALEQVNGRLMVKLKKNVCVPYLGIFIFYYLASLKSLIFEKV
jgi:hypothetical protein